MKPQEFYNSTYGKAYDVDDAYGYQCWDGMAKFCKDVGIPTGVIHCSKTGYVQDIWELKDKSGILNYFDEVSTGNFKNGDWVIWGRDYNMTPKSHVAMYWNGKAYGQSQNGVKAFNLCTLDFNKALGGFRWKEWSDKMTLKDGYQSITYQGANLKVFKGYGDYKQLHMLSAKGTEKAVQDIKNYDHSNMIIMALANCNYFEMSSKTEYGQHYGVEQSEGDGVHTSSLDLAPKNSAYEVFYQLKDGTCGRCTANDYWLSKEDVIFACTPYATVVFNGEKCNYKSSAFGNKDTTSNSQTMYMLVDDAWCIVATGSKVLPCVMQSYAIECGAKHAFIVDSGGSTQMMAYASKWESIIYTGRHIPNVLALAKVKTTDTDDKGDDKGDDTPTTDTVSKEEYDKLKAEYGSVVEENKTLQNEVTVLENKITEIKKIVEE